MNRRHKKPGYGNRGKTNYIFPPFPQPLLLLTNQDESSRTETKDDRLHKILGAASPGSESLAQLLSCFLLLPPASCSFLDCYLVHPFQFTSKGLESSSFHFLRIAGSEKDIRASAC
ncbi:MAG: hypothetical protein JWM21_575 [Acidobacteria bacterium]|nr:hypothetical protein [Acidobacteriota bacterium]